MRVLVCGGRDYADRDHVFITLSRIDHKRTITCVIHGDASGADALAEQWAANRRIARHRFPADWKQHGKAAGPIRNDRMLWKGKPELVVAFPGGTGTADMVRRAKEAGIEVIEVASPSACGALAVRP